MERTRTTRIVPSREVFDLRAPLRPSTQAISGATPVVARADRFDASAKDAPPAAPKIKTPAERLASAVGEHDVLEVHALLTEDPKLLEARDASGDTLLLAAARADAPGVVGLALHMGARSEACDKKGLSAPFVAAEKSAAALRVLLAQPRRDGAQESLWRAPQAIRTRLDECRKQRLDADALDTFAAKLTGGKAADFTSGWELQKFVTHRHALKENPFGVDPEGWNVTSFLGQRVRVLLDVAMHAEALLEPGEDLRVVLDGLAREIAIDLEGLRCRRRNLALEDVADPEVARSLARLEAAAIIERFENAPPGFEVLLPTGWEGHQLYASLFAREVGGEEVCTLRVDNHGAGVGHHRQPSEHVVHPRVLNIPKSALRDPELRALLVGCVSALMAIQVDHKSNENRDNFYSELDVLHGLVIAKLGPKVLDAGDTTYPARSKQTAGNCVVENHDAGVRLRLGESLGARVLAAETEQVTARLMQRLTPSVLAAAVKANRERIAKETQTAEAS